MCQWDLYSPVFHPRGFYRLLPPVFLLAISWLLYCRNASLIVVVLQGVSSLTIFLSHMSCEIEHLYTNHKYKVFPSEEKSVNQAQGVYNFPLRLRCLWNATSVKNWLLDKCDVWIYVIIVKKNLEMNRRQHIRRLRNYRSQVLCVNCWIWLNRVFLFFI